MFNISDYLKRFSKIEKDSEESKKAISEIFKDVCGVDDIDFDLKKGVIHIKSNPTVKSVVFMKKGALIERLSKHPTLKVFDVR